MAISTFSAGASEILRTAADVGVDIQLSQVTMGVFDSVASGIAGLLAPAPAVAAGSGIMGAVEAGVRSWSNYGHIASGFAQAAINKAIPTSTPTVQTLSASGSIAAYQLPPILRAEFSILVDDDNVRAGCDILGMDPLYLANEGKLICILPREKAEAALAVMRGCRFGAEAAVVGEVTEAEKPRVELRTLMGGTRLLSMLEGAQLPRIC